MNRGSIASWDEALYASVAKDILRSGNWFKLTLLGEPWVDKPPLAIWFTAFFYKCFGVNEFSARLFSALCGVGIVITTYFTGRCLFNRWIGFLGALVLLSSSVFFRVSRFGVLDAPLTLFFTLALYFFWLGRGRNRYLIFSGVAVGLAVMTKGFAAFLIFPIIGIYCLWAGEMEILSRSSFWIGVILAAAIALPWHLYAMLSDHDNFMKDIVVKHLLRRTTTALEGHAGRWDFYLRILVNKYHPWIVLGALSAPYFIFKAAWKRSEEHIFIVSWMFVIFFSATLIQTKLGWYIFPMYPALSLTVGYFLSSLFGQHRVLFIKVLFTGIMCLHSPFSGIFHHDYSHEIKGISEAVKRSVPADKTVYLYNFHESPAASFYLERKNAYLDDKASFFETVKNNPGLYCLIHDKNLETMSQELPSRSFETLAVFENFRLIHLK